MYKSNWKEQTQKTLQAYKDGHCIEMIPLKKEHMDNLYRWNQDPEILQWIEEDGETILTDEQIYEIYADATWRENCYLIQIDGKPVGEGWLQPLQLAEIIEKHQDNQQCIYRIDYMIGDKSYWGKGFGSEISKLLLAYGFLDLHIDYIYGFTKENNFASRKIFVKNGFRLDEIQSVSIRGKEQKRYRYVINRNDFISK